MGVMNKVMNFLGLQEEEEIVVQERDRAVRDQAFEEEELEAPIHESKGRNKANIVSIHSNKNVKVMLTEPKSYDEAQEIADYLRSRRPVIVNLHRVRGDHAVRIFDFLGGTVYALNGQISKIGPNIFLCTPDTVEIHGSITELLKDTEADAQE